MPGIGNVAVGAFQRLTAAVAEGIGSGSPAVEEENALFSHFQCFPNLPCQCPAEDLGVSVFQFCPHVSNHHPRRFDTGRALLQRFDLPAAALRFEHLCRGRCGGTQDQL